jgi:hypothetical protein
MAGSDITPFHEWQECRTTIARFDGYLADTRKYGFTLVTVLLTANALVTTGNTAVDRPAASIVIMALLFALFMLDNYYWALLRGTVGRAKELEAPKNRVGMYVQVTGVISDKVKESHATDLILTIYVVFVAVAAGIGLTAGATGQTVSAAWVIALIVVAVLDLVAMFGIFLIVQPGAPPAKWFLDTVGWQKEKPPEPVP